MGDDSILKIRFLFIFLILLVLVCSVSQISAENPENSSVDADVNFKAEDMPDYNPFTVGGECDHVGDDFKNDVLPDDVTVVGGDCDNINEINYPTSNHAEVTVIFVENKTPKEAKILLAQSGLYFADKTLTVKVIDNNGTALYSVPVTLNFSNGKTATVITTEKGEASYRLPFNPGTYSVNAKVTSNIIKVNDAKLGNIKIKNASATITLNKLSASYTSKKHFQIKVVNSKTKKGIGNVKLLAKVYINGKAKKIYLTTDSKGMAKFSTANLDVGRHKVEVREISKGVSAKARTSEIKVTKAPTTFLDEVGAMYIKKGGIYNIAVFNKNTQKVIKGAKLTVKVYTDKKVHTYVVKTGKYGADIDLGYLGLGIYKIIVKFDGNSKYQKCTGRDDICVIKSCGNVIF